MMRHARSRHVAGLAGVVILCGCGQKGARVDEATVDRGSPRNPAASEAAPRTAITLDSGASVLATPGAQSLQAYLESSDPARRLFELVSISFVQGGQVREDPNGSVASIVAVLKDHPRAKVQILVTHTNPGTSRISEASIDRAKRVADVFV